MDLSMPDGYSYDFYPLGDSAITLDLGNKIDESINKKIIAFFHQLQDHPFEGLIDILPAYSSLTIYYDVMRLKKIAGKKTVYIWVKEKFEKILQQLPEPRDAASRLVNIPVCYEKEFAPDLETMSFEKKLSADEIIHLHMSKQYRVYMLGFLPGFAYMGEVDDRIAMPRLTQPRKKVEAGSVGIAGKQTGIYPLDSPGGWNIIGKTPLKLFNAMGKELTLLRAGDMVQFNPISRDEFENYQSRHS